MSDGKKLSERVADSEFVGTWELTKELADEIAALEKRLAGLEGLRSGLARVLNEGASIQRADDKDDVLIVQDDGSIIGNLSIYFPYGRENTHD